MRTDSFEKEIQNNYFKFDNKEDISDDTESIYGLLEPLQISICK